MINSDREYPFDQTISQPSQRRNDEPMMQPDIQSAPASQDDDNGAAELNPAQGYDDPFPQYTRKDRKIAQLRQHVADLQNDLMLSEHERNILKNSLTRCGCKQDPQCPDQWYNERAEELQRTIAEKEARIAELQNRLDSLPENEGWSKQ